jgi:flagellar basal-body rod protein FlgB
MADLFQSTTIPLLEQVVNFAQARHTVLAGTIASADTPGYVTRDLSVQDFRGQLREALTEQHTTAASPSMNPVPAATPLAEVSRNPKSILYHDRSQVGMEYQVSEMVKNRIEHNTALAIMTSQFHLLQAAISERA